MCGRTLDGVRFLEVSLVTRPVQKYSVAFLKGEPYDYTPVQYVATRLLSPWHRWKTIRSSRMRLDPRFAGVGPKAPCACGSGRLFKRCHRSRSYREVPHVDVVFLDGMAEGLPAEYYGQPYHGVDDNS